VNDPVFLLGAEAAGSFLIGVALSAHAEVRWVGGFDWALDWPERSSGEWPALLEYWHRIALSPRARELRVRIDPSLELPDLVRELLEQQRGSPEQQIVASAAARYAQIVALWPSARFVYVHRSAHAGATPVERARVRESEREWRSVAAEIAPHARLELRYADLVSAPRAQLARVCDFVGIAYDDALLSRSHGPHIRPPRTRGTLLRRLSAATSRALGQATRLRARSLAALRSVVRDGEDLGRQADARVEQTHEAVAAQRLRDEPIAASIGSELRDAGTQRARALPEPIADREEPGDFRARAVFGTGGVRHGLSLRTVRALGASSTEEDPFAEKARSGSICEEV
jgi:hypothetical protein